MKTLAKTIILSLALCTASQANAASITWTLQDVTFNDGGVATGSFDYDALRNTYSNINIEGPGLFFDFPLTYTFVSPGSTGTNLVARTAPPGEDFFSFLNLNFDEALTDLGGTINLVPALTSQGRCSDLFCRRRISGPGIVSGAVFAPVSAIPIPGAAWMMPSGLGAAGLLARRRRNQAKNFATCPSSQ
ncbi:MAG: VPLPA-CTERM sorting domain-containing protein [Pseudomonadota bacterium]